MYKRQTTKGVALVGQSLCFWPKELFDGSDGRGASTFRASFFQLLRVTWPSRSQSYVQSLPVMSCDLAIYTSLGLLVKLRQPTISKSTNTRGIEDGGTS